MKDFHAAGLKADELIAGEIERQDKMWGVANERADSTIGQLLYAGAAQVIAVLDRASGNPHAFDAPPRVYPSDWTGFRSYGADVPNLVVAIAFLRQEIKRRIANGEDITRLSRDPVQQPYAGTDQPAVMLP